MILDWRGFRRCLAPCLPLRRDTPGEMLDIFEGLPLWALCYPQRRHWQLCLHLFGRCKDALMWCTIPEKGGHACADKVFDVMLRSVTIVSFTLTFKLTDQRSSVPSGLNPAVLSIQTLPNCANNNL